MTSQPQIYPTVQNVSLSLYTFNLAELAISHIPVSKVAYIQLVVALRFAASLIAESYTRSTLRMLATYMWKSGLLKANVESDENHIKWVPTQDEDVLSRYFENAEWTNMSNDVETPIKRKD